MENQNNVDAAFAAIKLVLAAVIMFYSIKLFLMVS